MKKKGMRRPLRRGDVFRFPRGTTLVASIAFEAKTGRPYADASTVEPDTDGRKTWIESVEWTERRSGWTKERESDVELVVFPAYGDGDWIVTSTSQEAGESSVGHRVTARPFRNIEATRVRFFQSDGWNNKVAPKLLELVREGHRDLWRDDD